MHFCMYLCVLMYMIGSLRVCVHTWLCVYPQRWLAMAGCDSTARISWRWEAGVWSNSYRQLLGPHLGTLLQEVKHTRTCVHTHTYMLTVFVIV